MLRAVGCACILCGGIAARRRCLADRRRRSDTLSDLLSALRRMGDEIRMVHTPLPVLLDRLAEGCGREAETFLRTVSSGLRRGEALTPLWRRSTEDLDLSGPARSALSELGERLHGDEESVCKAIGLTCSTLARELEEELRRRPEEDRRATALWLSSAALLAIALV